VLSRAPVAYQPGVLQHFEVLRDRWPAAGSPFANSLTALGRSATRSKIVRLVGSASAVQLFCTDA
jgi:hypothetical protein